MKAKTKAKFMKILKELELRKGITKEEIRPSIVKKEAIVKEIMDLLKKYKTIAIVDLERTPSRQYKEIKRKLSKRAFIKMYKNRLFLRAAEKVGLKNVDLLKPYLTGSNVFIFTDMNAYELTLLLNKLATKRYAKPGDIATEDIYIPAGPTGIPPGPMLSVFGKFRIPTQVREGIIWVAKDTRVVKAGEEINPDLIALLQKLDIAPMEVKLRVKAVWDEGVVIPAEELVIDIDAFKDELMKAVNIAREVAVETALPLPDVLPEIIRRAYIRATALVAEAGFVTPETAEQVFKAAITKAMVLGAILSTKAPDLGIEVALPAVAPAAAPQPAEEKKEEEEEEEKEEEVSEEEIAEGIASLFG
jgi:large subunit ribosomal protein L10